jgi:hypothetical protein
METSLDLREKAEQTRRLARSATDRALQIDLLKLADQYTTRADERLDEEIALGIDPA